MRLGEEPATVVAPEITLLDTVQLAREFAHHLLDPARQRPAVLVTRPSGSDRAWMDVTRIADEVQGVAAVYEMPTGKVTRAFSDELADFPRTECYGGAGRVYPTGLDWTNDVYQAPLHLVYSELEGSQATGRIIADALAAVYTAGYTTTTPEDDPSPASAVTAPASRGSEGEMEQLRREVTTLREVNETLTKTAAGHLHRAGKAEAALERAKATLSGVQSALDDRAADARAFMDAEAQFRYQVHLAWARRIPAAEKSSLPLPDYVIGPAFLDSLALVERGKAASVAMEVITGLSDTMPGRATHQLRTGPGPGDAVVRRADGATCWRVSIEHNSPQARRLHFWRLPDCTVELASVRLHDDMRP